MRQVRLFLHRQCVHIGAQSDNMPLGFLLTTDDADDADAANSFMNLIDAIVTQCPGNDFGCAMQVEQQFRMAVKVTAYLGNVRMERLNLGKDVHVGRKSFIRHHRSCATMGGSVHEKVMAASKLAAMMQLLIPGNADVRPGPM